MKLSPVFQTLWPFGHWSCLLLWYLPPPAAKPNFLLIKKQGRIVHRSGLNNENNKNRNKKFQNRKSEISYLTVQMVKADIF